MKKAFTLPELLIVLVIIGLTLSFITPVVGTKIAKGDEVAAFFEDLIKEHLAFAVEEGVSVDITGFKGSNSILTYDGLRKSIPQVKSVQSALLNGENADGLEYHIRVYPDGLCDHFVLQTDKGWKIESMPLSMKVRRIKQ